MKFEFSEFGERFTRATGALELMDDLGRAMSGESSGLMLGGGNPAKLPEMQCVFRKRLSEVANDTAQFERMLSNYAHPTGELNFRRSLAKLLANEYGWPLSADNIALTAGSQAGFFLLFNLFAGRQPDGSHRRILLPVTPEYVGYGDVGLDDDFFTARRPTIAELPDDFFKYHLDFDKLNIDESIAAVCVSRPTNPTGNVLTNAEMSKLEGLCQRAGVPLIVDNAYGAPFPNIIFCDAAPNWHSGIIFCMSLSKLGLPGARTGIVIADEAIIDALTKMTAVLNLAVGSVGPVLTQPLVESGEIIELSRRSIQPFYYDKAMRAAELLKRELAGLPFKIHQPEGAFFLWLWLPRFPISSAELYAKLKKSGLYVLSGHYFFAGLGEAWPHRNECLRISFAQDDDIVEQGLQLLAKEIRTVLSSSQRSGLERSV